MLHAFLVALAAVAKPGRHFHDALRDSFAKWTEDAGQDYRVRKFAPKTK